MSLPAPHRRAADAGFAGDLQRRQSVGRVEDDPGALHVLERPVSIADDGGKPRAIFDRDNHGNGLRHAGRIARRAMIVNPMIVSVH